MTSLSIALILQLAATHAPLVAPETVLAFAQAESGMNPLAIHDNDSRRSYAPNSISDAVTLAERLLSFGHSIDLGLLQISHRNLVRTGLTIENAFDPAESVRAGGLILVDAYQRCDGAPDRLRCMASIYNTGHPVRGIRNGYAARVWTAADQIVPAIKKFGHSPSPPPPPNSCGQPPPSWDGYAVAAYELCQRRSKEPVK
jgi:type IV secretion system protein VirB1